MALLNKLTTPRGSNGGGVFASRKSMSKAEFALHLEDEDKQNGPASPSNSDGALMRKMSSGIHGIKKRTSRIAAEKPKSPGS